MADLAEIFTDYKEEFCSGNYLKMVDMVENAKYKITGIERCQKSWGAAWQLISLVGMAEWIIYANQ